MTIIFFLQTSKDCGNKTYHFWTHPIRQDSQNFVCPVEVGGSHCRLVLIYANDANEKSSAKRKRRNINRLSKFTNY